MARLSQAVGAAVLLLAAAPAARAQNCSFRLDDSVPIADDAALGLGRWEFQIEVPDIADDVAAKKASAAIFAAAQAVFEADFPLLLLYEATGDPDCRDLYEDTELDVKPVSLGDTVELQIAGTYQPPAAGIDPAKFSKYKVTFEPDVAGALGVNTSISNAVYSGLEAECEAGKSKVYVDVRLPAIAAAGPTAAQIQAATLAGVGDPLEGLPAGPGPNGTYDLTGDKTGTRCHQDVFVKGAGAGSQPVGQLAYEWEEEKQEMTLLVLLWNPEDAGRPAAARYEAGVRYAAAVYAAAEEYDPSAPTPPTPSPSPSPPAPPNGVSACAATAAAAVIAGLAAAALA